MKHLFLAAAIVTLLASCQAQQSEQPDQEQTSSAAETAVETPDNQPAIQPPPQPAPPVGGAFQTPFPEGVVLSQPHHARMDVSVVNKNGSAGRRTEFEYLEGDAGQAMQAFATAMAEAGFASADGPSSEEGVVRQVFKKEGYGTVFARAQQQPPARNMHDSALGFVVVAWPGQGTIE